ncbi:hypothetical protein AAVH_16934 [Aphelenchoides avenae]|nr:hypothetical protein AAVH_16934 [Aphelenchus avenae]
MSRRRYTEVSTGSDEDLLKRVKESMDNPELFKAVLKETPPPEFDPRIVDFIASVSQYVPKPTKKILPSLPLEAVLEALRCLDADDIDTMRLSDDERPLRLIEKVHIGEEKDE